MSIQAMMELSAAQSCKEKIFNQRYRLMNMTKNADAKKYFALR